LVEHGQSVTDRAAAGPHHQPDHAGLDRDPLLLADAGQMVGHRLGRHQPERIVMGAAADRADDLLRLGGGEDEFNVRRRLLDQLEQGVETGRGDHVGLVHDVDLVTRVDRGEEGPFTQVAGVVDPAVGGGVDLDHVDAARPAPGQVTAGLALPAGVGRRPLDAVQGPGQDTGARSLAAAARAGEEISVIDPVVEQGPAQRLGDMGLADDVREDVRPVAPVQSQGRLWGFWRRRWDGPDR
jgi:hypothetical protein